MNEHEWDGIAQRLEGAWGPFPAARRVVYYDVLADLDATSVRMATDAMLREERETLPPPGVIRTRATGATGSSMSSAESGDAAWDGVAWDDTLEIRDSEKANVSLILGVLGLVALPVAASIAAIVFGILARAEIGRSPDTLTGEAKANWGIALGILGVVIIPIVFGLFLLLFFNQDWFFAVLPDPQ